VSDHPTDDPGFGTGDLSGPPSTGQLRRLHALIRQRFGDYRKTDVRADALTDISETVGRPIDTTGELTSAECSTLIQRYTPGPGLDDEPPTDEEAGSHD
jgi:hypothetical protein